MANKRRHKGFDYEARDQKPEKPAAEPEKPVSPRRSPMPAPVPRRRAAGK